MARCKSCGDDLKEGVPFCRSCGEPILTGLADSPAAYQIASVQLTSNPYQPNASQAVTTAPARIPWTLVGVLFVAFWAGIVAIIIANTHRAPAMPAQSDAEATRLYSPDLGGSQAFTAQANAPSRVALPTAPQPLPETTDTKTETSDGSAPAAMELAGDAMKAAAPANSPPALQAAATVPTQRLRIWHWVLLSVPQNWTATPGRGLSGPQVIIERSSNPEVQLRFEENSDYQVESDGSDGDLDYLTRAVQAFEQAKIGDPNLGYQRDRLDTAATFCGHPAVAWRYTENSQITPGEPLWFVKFAVYPKVGAAPLFVTLKRPASMKEAFTDEFDPMLDSLAWQE